MQSSSSAAVSALDLFSIGVGPSSSHTVGPMRAGPMFLDELTGLATPDRIVCVLHGSLAATGIGHGTPDAVIAGLRGLDPATCDPGDVRGAWEELAAGARLTVGPVSMTRDDIVFDPRGRDHGHPNALTFTAYAGSEVVATKTYLSIGGGFVVDTSADPAAATPQRRPASDYRNADELLRACADGRTIADIVFADECAFHGPEAANAGVAAIWSAMRSCVEAGLRTSGTLPGGLRTPRRAAAAHRELDARGLPLSSNLRLAIYAMAVNEENAAGGRVVTAPTNGAAGVIPAVLYHHVTSANATFDAVRTFLLTATAIGSIVKANASISGAQAGCQGEVGTACAMAAAGLCAVLGGTPAQIENAAEIALEHHLGLTCDPVAGLVQIPCIERNGVAANTAGIAAQLALLGDGRHRISLDVAIETMRQTGEDMMSKYKETSEGGLAVNIVEC
ncbi:MAG: L-serine ammonia-lyase [Gordonia sp. (in: high G+C Gram-positive bacteria)]